MKRILILRGISGSGKSTFAQKLVPEGYYVVSRDRIRLELLGTDGLEEYFSQGMDPCLEEYVTKLEEYEIAGHLIKNHKLVVDDTHIKRAYVQALVNLFYETKTPTNDVELVEFDISIEEARERCDKRDKKPISNEVLQRQFEGFQDRFTLEDFKQDSDWIPRRINRKGKITNNPFEPRNWFIPDFDTLHYIPNLDLPKAVLIDLDGTTAHRAILTKPNIHMRSYYSYKEVYEDEPDLFTKTIVQSLIEAGIEPVFLSGRKSYDIENGKRIDVRLETERYIKDKLGVTEPTLYMRNPDKDIDINGKDLKDDIVKHRILHEEVAPNFQVIGALDDRARVCAVWEDIGIKCLNCSSPNDFGRY